MGSNRGKRIYGCLSPKPKKIQSLIFSLVNIFLISVLDSVLVYILVRFYSMKDTPRSINKNENI